MNCLKDHRQLLWHSRSRYRERHAVYSGHYSGHIVSIVRIVSTWTGAPEALVPPTRLFNGAPRRGPRPKPAAWRAVGKPRDRPGQIPGDICLALPRMPYGTESSPGWGESVLYGMLEGWGGGSGRSNGVLLAVLAEHAVWDSFGARPGRKCPIWHARGCCSAAATQTPSLAGGCEGGRRGKDGQRRVSACGGRRRTP